MSTHDHSHLWPGVPMALASAVLFGASTPLSKLLLGAIDPWLLAGLSISARVWGSLSFISAERLSVSRR